MKIHFHVWNKNFLFSYVFVNNSSSNETLMNSLPNILYIYKKCMYIIIFTNCYADTESRELGGFLSGRVKVIDHGLY